MKRNWSQDVFSDFNVEETKKVTKKSSQPRNKSQNSRPKKKSTREIEKKVQEQVLGHDTLLWSEIFSPADADDLVINKKKINEFTELLLNSNEKIILVSGPSGCGKHCLIKLMCAKNNINVYSWANVYDDYDGEAIDSFKEFIRSACYQELSNSKIIEKVLIIDDIPELYLKNKNQFLQLMLLYFRRLTYKLIFVYKTNDRSCAFSTFCNIFFDDETMMTLKVRILKLNPLTNTSLMKIYKNLINVFDLKEIKEILELIKSSQGDARYFLNTLQFIQNKNLSCDAYLGFNFKDILTYQKDSFCDIFHSAGRLFYAKRTEISDACQLQEELISKSRNTLELDLNEFIRTLNISHLHLIYVIHENYLFFITDFDLLLSFSDDLAIIDMISSFWDDSKYSFDMLQINCIYIAALSLTFNIDSSNKKQSFRPIYNSKIYAIRQEAKTNSEKIMNTRLKFNYSTRDYILDIQPYFEDKLKQNLYSIPDSQKENDFNEFMRHESGFDFINQSLSDNEIEDF